MGKLTVGIVGWRGMVGSVLSSRMEKEYDYEIINPVYFSTSQAGQPAPVRSSESELLDAFDLDKLSVLDVILTSQGGDYTKKVHPELRAKGWQGYWIDAASTLRMNHNSLLVLDPVNRQRIDEGLDNGIKDLVGANCTVSTMLIGLTGLFKSGLVEWTSSMTYQAASGAGAKNMIELLRQMKSLGIAIDEDLNDPAKSILDVDKKVSEHLSSDLFPTELFGYPLAASLLPWIDTAVDSGQTREEWKGMVETNKILGTSNLPVDGTCVRVGTMRSHAHGLTIKLSKDVPLEEIEDMISTAHEWVKLIPNEPEQTKSQLTSATVSGQLKIHVGRVRKMTLGPQYLNVFTVGDQLLWGAAEPLRRALRIIAERA